MRLILSGRYKHVYTQISVLFVSSQCAIFITVDIHFLIMHRYIRITMLVSKIKIKEKFLVVDLTQK